MEGEFMGDDVKVDKKLVTFSQINDVLEERQRPDRRQQDDGLPQNIQEDRRRGDRREKNATE
jgi:hypothetical protein